MPNSSSEKLTSLRATLKDQNLNGLVVPHADEFLSEYLPQNAERLAWLTGFTGSAGYAVVLTDKAVAMTHGIYEIQIRKQVDQTLYSIEDFTKCPIGDWLAANAKSGSVIGYDPRLMTRQQIEMIEKKTSESGIKLKPVTQNPIDAIWTDRPSAPLGQVELFPDNIAGATSLEKRQKIAEDLKTEKISSVVITQSDSICWLLNVRGSDIDYNPLVLSSLILHKDGHANWYVDARKIPQDVVTRLGKDIRICSPDDFETDLKKSTSPVQIDPQRSPMVAETVLKESGIEKVDGKDPCVLPKSIKTQSEQRAIKQAHIRDGIAVTKFLHWLDCQDFKKIDLTEIDLEKKLEEFRQGHASYRGNSFGTISGWASNGAIIHYHATPESNQRITSDNLYLVDSGGQYEYGTTDITRTIVIGKIDQETKNCFTRVLKGHIAVASAVMDDTLDGASLDKLARASLQEDGKDYAHGTGHGVGCFLAVHEEATYIAPRSTGEVFKSGMLLSNEPGYYREDHFGIRHENLMLCQENEDGTLYWETITVVPFDLRGVDWALITDAEKKWLESYHSHVFETISPYLYSEEVDWLREVCFSYFE
ncbi:MAG: aminopeptidase P family protein [Alphaproteobacteria bacterium]|jgi:Xaa-Pro aminopeptidase|nr:aminopeptidase P family protein [Alphaproteobacteria bacterium]